MTELVASDAVSSHAVALHGALQGRGHWSRIYVERLRSLPEGSVRSAVEVFPADPPRDAIAVYHQVMGSPLANKFCAWSGPRVLAYHNVTPPYFFEGWDPPVAAQCEEGRIDIRRCAPNVDLGLADSTFNKIDLDAAGVRRSEVVPVVPDSATFEVTPDSYWRAELERRKERGPIWAFVGRFAPNKGQADLVRAFAGFCRATGADATLVLVGGPFTPSYRNATLALAESLGVRDSVLAPGLISASRLAATYAASDVYVSLSEHEGFGVPLLEAMQLGVPIVALGAAAVPETVGEAAVLLPEKDPLLVAAAVNEVLSNYSCKTALIDFGHRRAEELLSGAHRDRTVALLEDLAS